MELYDLDCEPFFKEYERRGYNIGIRLIDEFLAKSKTTKCVDFKDTANKVARVNIARVLPVVSTSMVFDCFAPAGGVQDVSECKCSCVQLECRQHCLQCGRPHSTL